MKSTSSDGVIVRDLPSEGISPLTGTVDLRTGTWTRLGSASALGDAVTEEILGGIAQRSHQAARAQGYAQGWAEGRRVALTRAEEEAEQVRRATAADRERQQTEHLQAIAALEAAVEKLSSCLAAALDELAEHTVEVALQLAEAVVGREVATALDPGADALRRAMSRVQPEVTATIRLHPSDRALLDPAVLEGRDLVVVVDPAIARGDAVAETEDTLVDATVAAALARVREVLTR